MHAPALFSQLHSQRLLNYTLAHPSNLYMLNKSKTTLLRYYYKIYSLIHHG